MTKSDRWPELCRIVATDDGLPTRACGAWTEKKLYFWNSYIHITTMAMVDNPAWKGGLAYVDLFAGPGVCEIREPNRRIPGSPLIAAHAPKPFSKIICVEKDSDSASACRARLARSPAANRSKVIGGDCNQVVGEVVAQIPDQALTLAFIDPEGMDVPLATLKHLASNRRVDFLLLFADSVDALRNIELYDIPDSKMDSMFGPDSGWREALEALPNNAARHKRQVLRATYQRQLTKHLGYAGFRTKEIRGPRGPLYSLLYASRHERGLEFWDKATSKDVGGQKSLFEG